MDGNVGGGVGSRSLGRLLSGSAWMYDGVGYPCCVGKGGRGGSVRGGVVGDASCWVAPTPIRGRVGFTSAKAEDEEEEEEDGWRFLMSRTSGPESAR